MPLMFEGQVQNFRSINHRFHFLWVLKGEQSYDIYYFSILLQSVVQTCGVRGVERVKIAWYQ